MRRKIALILILLFLLPGIGFAKKKKLSEEELIKQLPKKYRDWLDVVWWIITPEEKKVFLQLKNNRDRDLFIKAFWKMRDPTPGTPRNEFMEEHYRRFHYANKYFGRETSRPGWKTDRGRVYIILGPPVSIERFYMNSHINPTEVWYYYGDPRYGLPPHFALVFYKPHGVGEFRLYNPAVDGPYSLLMPTPETRNLDPTNFEQIYEYLLRAAPTLAPVSLSLIPGEIPYNFQPSLSSNMIIANVLDLPKKKFKSSYAKDFLKYKGIVEVEYSLNYIEARYLVTVIKNDFLNEYFLNYSIQPKVLSVSEYKNKIYANFEIVGNLKDGKGNSIFQFKSEYGLEFTRKQLERARAVGFALQGMAPVIPGRYRLTLLVKNTVSKEFSYIEVPIKVPEKYTPFVEKPLLALKFQPYRIFALKPFVVDNKALTVSAVKSFTLKERPYFFVKVDNIDRKLWKTGKLILKFSSEDFEKTIEFPLVTKPYRPSLVFTGLVPENMPAGEYELEAVLKKGEVIISASNLDFNITPLTMVARPVIYSKTIPLKNRFAIYHMIAQQYRNKGNLKMALKYTEKAVAENPAFKKGKVDLAELYLMMGQPDKALNLLTQIGTKGDAYLLFLEGKAYEMKGDVDTAIEKYYASIDIYDSDIRVLNSLANCLLKKGEKEEAIKVLKASLKINPKQKKIKELLQNLTAK